ncbi:MAG TPA: hypothetical protein VHC69_10050 [Polyangiaceae bacterium]|nr:hypothetical protein [Polyangiaceae bacterium]
MTLPRDARINNDAREFEGVGSFSRFLIVEADVDHHSNAKALARHLWHSTETPRAALWFAAPKASEASERCRSTSDAYRTRPIPAPMMTLEQRD